MLLIFGGGLQAPARTPIGASNAGPLKAFIPVRGAGIEVHRKVEVETEINISWNFFQISWSSFWSISWSRKHWTPELCKALKGGTTSPSRMQRFTVGGVHSLLSTNTQKRTKMWRDSFRRSRLWAYISARNWWWGCQAATRCPKQPQADQGAGWTDAHPGGSQRCYFKEGRSQLITL